MDSGQYLQWLFNNTPSMVRAWIDEGTLFTALQRDFEATLQHRTHVDAVTEFAQSCPVPGASTDDYMLREISPMRGVSILAGIHFYALDPARPFVGVYAQSRNLTLSETQTVTAALTAQFAQFRPTAVWWWCSADRPDLRTLPAATGDQRLVVGELAAISARPLPEPVMAVRLPPDSGSAGSTIPMRANSDLATRLRLIADEEGASYDRYCTIFAGFLEAYPQWRGRLELTARADYDECAREGGLFTVEIDGHFAGVMAAQPGEIRGIPGWVIV
ncbi:MAG: hypothetical protein R6W76_20380 [Caldilinea sp.]